MRATNSDDIFRLYVREWVIVHTLEAKSIASDQGAEVVTKQLHDDASAWITLNLDGRVRERDIRLTMHNDQANSFWCHVEVFRDNLKGEFKQFSAAETHAHIHHYDEYTIVPRNSPADRQIRNFGVTKL